MWKVKGARVFQKAWVGAGFCTLFISSLGAMASGVSLVSYSQVLSPTTFLSTSKRMPQVTALVDLDRQYSPALNYLSVNYASVNYASVTYASVNYASREFHPSLADEDASNGASFEANTLYSLLVAELAVHRQQYDLALGNYLLEAHRTQDPQVAKQAALIAQHIGADQAALDAASLWVRLEPEEPQAQEVFAFELLKAHRFKEASLHLQEAISLGVITQFEYLSTIAEGLDWEGRAGLIGALDLVLQVHSGNAALWYQKASILNMDEEYGLAMEANEKALSIRATPHSASMKVRLLLKMERDVEAQQELDKLLEKFPNARGLLVLKAKSLIGQKQVLDAQKVFAKLVGLYPADSPIRLTYALTALELSQFDLARQQLQMLVQQDQLANDANFYLGQIAEKEQMPALAIERYQLVNGGKQYLPSRARIAAMMVVQEEEEAALEYIAELRKVHEETGAWEEQYYLLELALLIKAERFDQAISLSDKSIRRYPVSERLLFQRAMLAQTVDDYEGMEKFLRRLISVRPMHSAALNALGYMLVDQDRKLDEAKEFLERAIGIDPNDPAIIDSMGWYYYRVGDFQAAKEYIKRAYDKMPVPEVAAHYGEVLWVTGDENQAADVWTKALEKSPNSDILLRTQDRFVD